VSLELRVNDTLKLKALSTQSDTAKDLAKRWNWMVYFYSSSDLTFAKDKLVAFSGMARVMQRILKDGYVGGLWEKEFMFHLIWSAQRQNTTKNRRLKEYLAPSWSWASMNCITRYLEWWKAGMTRVRSFANSKQCQIYKSSTLELTRLGKLHPAMFFDRSTGGGRIEQRTRHLPLRTRTCCIQ
jgi:hypothetical protein